MGGSCRSKQARMSGGRLYSKIEHVTFVFASLVFLFRRPTEMQHCLRAA